MKNLAFLMFFAVFTNVFAGEAANCPYEHVTLDKSVFLVKVVPRQNKYTQRLYTAKELGEQKRFQEVNYAVAYSVGTEYYINATWAGGLTANGGVSVCSASSPTGAVSYSPFSAHKHDGVIYATVDSSKYLDSVCRWGHEAQNYDQFVAIVDQLPVDARKVKFVKLEVKKLKANFR